MSGRARIYSHRLVVLALPDHLLSPGHTLIHVRRKQHPQLPTTQYRVPRACTERVYVHGRPGSLGADQEPPLLGKGKRRKRKRREGKVRQQKKCVYVGSSAAVQLCQLDSRVQLCMLDEAEVNEQELQYLTKWYVTPRDTVAGQKRDTL